MNVLGIETSCDETAAAVVQDGTRVLSNVVASQISLHGPYGGVVPELACRAHLEALPGVLQSAVEQAGIGWRQVDAVAVTYGPGLASSLLVGLSAAKALALSLQRPLFAVNHMEAHICSVFLNRAAGAFAENCPLLALLVSGGHTCLVRVEAPDAYRLLGQTVDDAAGEAFDKASNLLGLGYPGGPLIDRLASGGNRSAVRFPRGRLLRPEGELIHGMQPGCCFSFSGLKTALMYHLREHSLPDDESGEKLRSDLCASYQEAVIDALLSGVEFAVRLERPRRLAVCGGVSLNSRLHERIAEFADEAGIDLLLAERQFCADNAAMVAGLAGAGRGITGAAAMQLDIDPNLAPAAV